MADTVAVMNKGRIEQMGAPRELYELPKTAFVANFLGKSNLMSGQVVEDQGDFVAVNVAGSRVLMPKDRAVSHSGAVVVGVRPEKMRIMDMEMDYTHTANQITGTVLDASFTGVSTEYLVDVPGIGTVGTFSQNLGQRPAAPGETVRLTWEPEYSFGLEGGDGLGVGLEAASSQVASGGMKAEAEAE